MVTVQTKVSALKPQYGADSDASRSFSVVKCASSSFSCAHDANDRVDHSFRDFASWGTVSLLSTSLPSWLCSSKRFTSEHRFLSLLGLGVYGVGDLQVPRDMV